MPLDIAPERRRLTALEALSYDYNGCWIHTGCASRLNLDLSDRGNGPDALAATAGVDRPSTTTYQRTPRM